MAIQYVSYIAIRVSDLERSCKFYRDLLGFRETSHFALEGPSPTSKLLGREELSVRAVFLERDGVRIELQHLALTDDDALPPPRPQLGLSHVGLRVDDFDATVARLERGGARVLTASRFSHPGMKSEVVVVEDPDGVRIELIQLPGDPTAPIGEAVHP